MYFNNMKKRKHLFDALQITSTHSYTLHHHRHSPSPPSSHSLFLSLFASLTKIHAKNTRPRRARYSVPFLKTVSGIRRYPFNYNVPLSYTRKLLSVSAFSRFLAPFVFLSRMHARTHARSRSFLLLLSPSIHLLLLLYILLPAF